MTGKLKKIMDDFLIEVEKTNPGITSRIADGSTEYNVDVQINSNKAGKERQIAIIQGRYDPATEKESLV